MSEYIAQIKDEVEADIVALKTYFDDVKRTGRNIKDHEDRLDKKFYLESQDVLSDAFDEINRAYLRVKAQADIAEAESVIKVINDNEKKPTDKVMSAMVQQEIKDLTLAEALLEGWMKSTKNHLQTCRNHIMAITGREATDNSKDSD